MSRLTRDAQNARTFTVKSAVRQAVWTVVNDAENPNPDEEAYGTIEIVFTGCNDAALTYHSPDAGVSCKVLLRRIP